MENSESSDKILKSLDEYQAECVKLGLNQALLISAPPGGGKTRTMLTRLYYMIKFLNVAPSTICCVTFTKKAAGEMKVRLRNILPPEMVNSMTIGTIHHFCYSIILKHARLLGFPNGISKVSDSEKKEILSKYLGASTNHERFELVSKIEYWKKKQFDEDFKRVPSDLKYKLQVYNKKLREIGKVDFTDMIILAYKLLKSNSRILKEYQEKLNHFCVDEFQDTNALQLKIFNLLVTNDNIFVVGDKDQSIYQFRGTTSKTFEKFKKFYPTCVHKILLNNYRSTSYITQSADEIIAHNKNRTEKRKINSIRGDGLKIQIISLQDNIKEKKFIESLINYLVEEKKTEDHSNDKIFKKFFSNKKIKKEKKPKFQEEKINGFPKHFLKIKDLGIQYSDIGILCRMNYPLTRMETVLKSAKIPYIRFGSQSLFDREDIKDIIAHFFLALYSDDQKSDLHFKTIINKPTKKIGEKKIEKIKSSFPIGGKDWSLFKKLKFIFSNRKGDKSIKKKFTTSNFKVFEEFIKRIEKIKKLIKKEKPIADIIDYIVLESEYSKHFEKLIRNDEKRQKKMKIQNDIGNIISSSSKNEENDSLELTETRSFNVACLKNDSKQFQDVDSFLRYVANDETEVTSDAVSLSTIHKAKGLEFKIVLIIESVDGILPCSREDNNRSSDDRGIEERNLCYVAHTRGKDCVIYTFPRETKNFSGETIKQNNSSPFFKEMGIDNIESLYFDKDNEYRMEKSATMFKSHSRYMNDDSDSSSSDEDSDEDDDKTYNNEYQKEKEKLLKKKTKLNLSSLKGSLDSFWSDEETVFNTYKPKNKRKRAVIDDPIRKNQPKKKKRKFH